MGHYNDIIKEDREKREEKSKKTMKQKHKESIHKELKSVIAQELSYARTSFPPMNSSHEGYATLKEEIEELQDEVLHIESKLQMMWDAIKCNDLKRIGFSINSMIESHILLVHEAIQVAAMIERFKEDIIQGGKS